MDLFFKIGIWDERIEGGSESVRKCVRRFGTRVGRRWNQKEERSVRRGPFEGIPWKMLVRC
jgi:hypothetical protein